MSAYFSHRRHGTVLYQKAVAETKKLSETICDFLPHCAGSFQRLPAHTISNPEVIFSSSDPKTILGSFLSSPMCCYPGRTENSSGSRHVASPQLSQASLAGANRAVGSLHLHRQHIERRYGEKPLEVHPWPRMKALPQVRGLSCLIFIEGAAWPGEDDTRHHFLSVSIVFLCIA